MRKNVKRLEEIAFKTVKTMMKKDKEFSTQVMSVPFLKTLLQTTKKNMPLDYSTLFLRYVQLRLVQSVFVLLQKENGCLIELVFPYHRRIELTTDHDEKNHLVFHVNSYRRGSLENSYSFWNSHEFTLYLISVFMEKFPKEIRVFRSSLSISSAPIHKFLTAVDDAYDTTIPKKLFRLYDQQNR